MASAARSAVGPLYLLACLLLGGSAQGIWQNAVLQLAGIAIIAWSAVDRRAPPPGKPARLLLLLVAAAIALVALQLVPVPPLVWGHGTDARLVEDYRILGRPAPWHSISLTPYASLATLLSIIPPLALFCAMVRLNAYRTRWLAAALLAGAIAGTMLGAAQVTGGAGNSFWYPHAKSNMGFGAGFFADASDMATLAVISLPFAAALAVDGRSTDKARRAARILVFGAIGLVLVVGIALNGSICGAVLAVPVLAASALFVFPVGSLLRRAALGLALVSLVAAGVAVATGSLGSTRISRDAATSLQSRETIMQTTGKAILDHLPFGSGLGSFAQVYRLYEDPGSLGEKYVVHAHDDYAETMLELGVPGCLLIIVFLGWWFQAVAAVWRRGEGGPFAYAATIASAAILVLSLVDFPLRTAAISVCFAMCVALLAERRKRQLVEVSPLRPVRHVVFS